MERKKETLSLWAAVGSIAAVLLSLVSRSFSRRGARDLESLIRAEDDHNDRPPKNL